MIEVTCEELLHVFIGGLLHVLCSHVYTLLKDEGNGSSLIEINQAIIGIDNETGYMYCFYVIFLRNVVKLSCAKCYPFEQNYQQQQDQDFSR